MNLKKHKESVFKSFRENKKEIKAAEKNRKYRKLKEWFNSPEQIERRREQQKWEEFCYHSRMGGLGDYCAKYDKSEMLEAHRQLHSLQWEQANPR